MEGGGGSDFEEVGVPLGAGCGTAGNRESLYALKLMEHRGVRADQKKKRIID